MRLPQYNGKYNVGAIDLEIPVREPRSFGAEYVSNDLINKPKRRRRQHRNAAERFNRQANEAAEKRKAGGDDLNVDEERSNGVGEGRNSKEWNPFTGGSSTMTLHLSTVLFTIFYPTEKTDGKVREGSKYSEVAWMGKPRRKGVAAFLSYLSQYGPFAFPASPAVLSLLTAKIPALAGAGLADPPSQKEQTSQAYDSVETGNFGAQPPKFPLIIFSHGLAGNRLSYSQFCGELASRGVIVAALEHRDGSGISSSVRIPQSGERTGPPKIAKMSVPYFSFETIGLRSFAKDPSEEEAGLRRAQLAMRSAEIKECLHILQAIQNGRGEEMANRSTRGLTSKLGEKVRKGKEKEERSREEARRLQLWKGKMDADFPTLCGHSFGGATVIEMQRKGPIVTEQGEKESNEDGGRGPDSSSSSPFPYTIVLDPWVEPLEWRVEGEEKDGRPMIRPAYCINSETFTIWKEHFAKLKRIMHDSREADSDHQGWLMTLCGCQHLDFSDMPFLLPHVFRSTVGPRATIDIFCRATYAQMGLCRQRRREEDDLPGSKFNLLTSRLEGAAQNQREIDGKDGNGFSEKGNGVIDEEPQRINSPEVLSVEKPGRQLSGLEVSKVKKEEAGQKLWKSKSEREEREARVRKARRREVVEQRQKRGLVAVLASRTPSGNIKIIKGGEETVDFSERGDDVAADRDATEVHKSLEEISEGLDYKKPKIHSLMAFLFRLKGIRPGLEQPGKVLIHHF